MKDKFWVWKQEAYVEYGQIKETHKKEISMSFLIGYRFCHFLGCYASLIGTYLPKVCN
jgi:hypothetical protein